MKLSNFIKRIARFQVSKYPSNDRYLSNDSESYNKPINTKALFNENLPSYPVETYGTFNRNELI
jgi:hypothetical protein